MSNTEDQLSEISKSVYLQCLKKVGTSSDTEDGQQIQAYMDQVLRGVKIIAEEDIAAAFVVLANADRNVLSYLEDRDSFRENPDVDELEYLTQASKQWK